MQKVLVFCLAALTLSGCASIISGTTQEVAIRTTPGAKFVVISDSGSQVASGEVGESAVATMKLVRGASYFTPHSYRVKLSKPGYRPSTVNIDSGMNGWYFANIAIGGLVGMVIVDPLTGAMFRLVPRVDEALLTPSGEDVAENEAGQSSLAKTRN